MIKKLIRIILAYFIKHFLQMKKQNNDFAKKLVVKQFVKLERCEETIIMIIYIIENWTI